MQQLTIPIIYQSHDLLVVNKPASLVIHPTYKHSGDTMWDMLLASRPVSEGDGWRPPILPDEPQWAKAPPHIQEMLRERRMERLWKEGGLLPRPCLLHRIDKDTSGIVALARTENARRHMIRQFHNHTIIKRYLAVVRRSAPEWSRPRAELRITQRLRGQIEQGGQLDHAESIAMLSDDEELLIDGPLWRDPDDRRRCIVTPEGQEAKTLIRKLASSEGLFLLEAQPVTGRTHQIRAHLAACGYAIVGDPIYSIPAEEGTPEGALHRQFLHAHSLTFREFPDNKHRTLTAPLADDLSVWLEQYFPTGAIYANTVST